MDQVIIVPGLGNRTDYIENLTRHWPDRYHLQVTTCNFRWDEPADTYEAKKERLHKKVQERSEFGKVAVGGISAGGNVAMNSLVLWPDEVACVFSICGLIRLREQDKTDPRLLSSPLLQHSLAQLDESKIDGSKAMTLRPLFDSVVNPVNVTIEGATNIRMHTIWHTPSIIWALFGRANTIAHFVQSKM